MYLVTNGDETQSYDTRASAIDAAKEISAGHWNDVRVEDETGREALVYRGGSLDFYVFETRRPRR